jgi:hypothetical protein
VASPAQTRHNTPHASPSSSAAGHSTPAQAAVAFALPAAPAASPRRCCQPRQQQRAALRPTRPAAAPATQLPCCAPLLHTRRRCCAHCCRRAALRCCRRLLLLLPLMTPPGCAWQPAALRSPQQQTRLQQTQPPGLWCAGCSRRPLLPPRWLLRLRWAQSPAGHGCQSGLPPRGTLRCGGGGQQQC